MSEPRAPRPGEVEACRHQIDALGIRKRLGRKQWRPPAEHGEGWWFDEIDANRRIIVTYWPGDLDPDEPIGADWLHASISHRMRDVMPTYADLKLMHHAVFNGGHAYQVFVPPDEHINIRENVLHLWGRVDGEPALPNFGKYGSI